MKRISFFAVAGLCLFTSDVFAQEWGNIATVSETTPGYLCAHDPDATGDDQIDCSTLSPYVATDGDIGIGTSAPSRTLTISGTTWTKSLELSGEAGGAGVDQTFTEPYRIIKDSSSVVVTSGGAVNVNGTLTLTGATGGAGVDQTVTGADDLGDHTATQDLDINGNNIISAAHVSAADVSVTGILQVSGDAGDTCSSTTDRGKIRVDPNTGLIQVCRWDD